MKRTASRISKTIILWKTSAYLLVRLKNSRGLIKATLEYRDINLNKRMKKKKIKIKKIK